MAPQYVEDIAAVCHEANRAYCARHGDHSQASWSDAPQWQRDSCIAGVELHLKNPELTPIESHEAWLKHKAADGWVHGAEKSETLKTHPCMLPYAALPVEQRRKVWLFKAIVNALAPSTTPVD